MVTASVSSTQRFDRLAIIAGIIAVIALIALMSGWTGPGNSAVTIEAFITLLWSLPLPLMCLAAAIGFGWPLRRGLASNASSPVALQVGLGVAIMLIIDAALGAIGLLALRAVAWLIIATGIALLLWQIVRHFRRSRDIPLPHWIFWACAPAIAVLLLAACSAPGWLWASEFGGYDALSYHLQLPKEWLARGRIVPLDHNVYSFLPGYVEAAYLHVMSLRGGPASALIDCQVLHALLTILSAVMTGVVASRFGGQLIGCVAAAVYLSTPWTIIVGSLGYNEMAVNLLLATGLLIVFDNRVTPARRGLLVGLVSAAACGAKLTSLGFVAAPLGLLLLMRASPRAWLAAMTCAVGAGLIGLLPYLLRNAMHGGNPVFPFATELLGTADWTSEQAQLWHRGPITDAYLGPRLRAIRHQFLVYGIGANPDPNEPWKAQWSVLPWLGALGCAVAMARSSLRRDTTCLLIVLLTQVAFWLAFTHLKSRFLLPAAVPLSILTAIGLPSLLHARPSLAASRIAAIIAALALLAISTLSMWIYRTEGNGAPALAIGTVSTQTGDALLPSERVELGRPNFPAIAINPLLPEGSRVLLVGEAAPLYLRLDRITYNTVWDRGPLSKIMRDSPDDPEAWRLALRQWKDGGFTHVLVNYTMLDVWERSGWNDPLITRRSVTDFTETAGEPLYDYPNDITLYALPD